MIRGERLYYSYIRWVFARSGNVSACVLMPARMVVFQSTAMSQGAKDTIRGSTWKRRHLDRGTKMHEIGSRSKGGLTDDDDYTREKLKTAQTTVCRVSPRPPFVCISRHREVSS